MEIPKIHESEYRFCLIMWEREPVTAVELVKVQLSDLSMLGSAEPQDRQSLCIH